VEVLLGEALIILVAVGTLIMLKSLNVIALVKPVFTSSDDAG